jgi:hypothetical protein
VSGVISLSDDRVLDQRSQEQFRAAIAELLEMLGAGD